MKLNIGVVMDPIASIKPKKDSTLAMMLEAQRRGWNLFYLEPGGLRVRDGTAQGRMREVVVDDDPQRWFALGPASDRPLADLRVILMRKDPPFDLEYIYATYILELAEAEGVLVVNKPRALRDANEKMAINWFPRCCPPTLVTRETAPLRAFLAEIGDIVVKPLDGMGGKSVFYLRQGDLNTSVILETITDNERRLVMAQAFIPQISEGDKRILMVDGQPIPQALARIPAAGELRGNLAAGGTGVGVDLSDSDRQICARVGPLLRQWGVIFAGLDVIGPFLTEINVTSPTGIRELDRIYRLNIAGVLCDAIEGRLAGVL